MHEARRSGLEAIETATRLLQRNRLVDPDAGIFEAAEMQWWWRRPSSTDDLEQLFWFDDEGGPVAAALLFDFGTGGSSLYDQVTFCPWVLPDADSARVAHVVDRGLAAARERGIEVVDVEIGTEDVLLQQVLQACGFVIKEPNAVVSCWLDVPPVPEQTSLATGYRLAARSEVPHLPHHMIGRNGPAVQERLDELSLYRRDVDLVVLDEHDQPAAYGLFWFDPVTMTGVVEPMRTLDTHQRLGLARHVLTSGVNRLAELGAMRISIGYEPDNPASGHLYRSVGFVPTVTTDLWTGPTTTAPK